MNQWERQPRESYPAFNAFRVFLTVRSYPDVSKQLSKSLSLIKRWAKQYAWKARADAWDNEISRKAMEKASEDFTTMVERQLNIGRLMQAKSANALKEMDLTNLPPKFIPALVSMLKAGVDIERSARELQIEKPQEDLFVNTLTRMWRESDGDD